MFFGPVTAENAKITGKTVS